MAEIKLTTCSIDTCDNPPRRYTYCTKHAGRFERHGDPLKVAASTLRTPAERFARFIKVTETGCHEWQGGKLAKGYGVFKYKGRNWAAHRWAWTQAHGVIPDGEVVRHRCDNPPCVNVDHLVVGTTAQNATDMVQRGRSLVGVMNHEAKLTESDVREIRNLIGKRPWTYALIADRYGVSTGAVSHIANGKTWTHVR